MSNPYSSTMVPSSRGASFQQGVDVDATRVSARVAIRMSIATAEDGAVTPAASLVALLAEVASRYAAGTQAREIVACEIVSAVMVGGTIDPRSEVRYSSRVK